MLKIDLVGLNTSLDGRLVTNDPVVLLGVSTVLFVNDILIEVGLTVDGVDVDVDGLLDDNRSSNDVLEV